ncbi:MAG: hypothetical protein FJ109_20955, partial [Deltaproteobacteria bacterium]|nr:hypothetical protein [Deltaproteobacteria bacterium]
MESGFILTDAQLVEVAVAFRRELSEGLARDGGAIRCLPTWCATGLPPAPEPALVLDVGGTNLRAAQMELAAGRWKPVGEVLESRLPVERGRPLARSRFLTAQVELLARVARGASGL